MSILRHLLLVAITLRLLMPPGVCVCKLSSPAVHLLCLALGGEPPVTAPEHDDHDHHPGCPASGLSEGLGVQPAAVHLDHPSLSLDCPVPPFGLAPDATAETPLDPTSLPRSTPLYVSRCAWLL
ncbi:MAG: hypothetical protein U0797_28390 [Gemmataceae bacterium]